MTDKEQKWLDALILVDTILKQQGIAYFLDLGTLLGAVRDGKFIEWDNDMDLGTIGNNYSRSKVLEVARALGQAGFSVSWLDYSLYLFQGDVELCLKLHELDESKTQYCIVESRTTAPDRIRLHIYRVLTGRMVYAAGGRLAPLKVLFIRMASLLPMSLRMALAKPFGKGIQIEARMKVIDRKYMDTLGEMEFYGRIFPVPADKEGYLTCRYGDWRTPKKEFDYMKDDLSFV